ncbi:hypothetical protein BM607_003085 [Shewanella sp. SACH]|uniref:hypothetical protein n=1 Tax=Shewanella sp. SACH TaxID=1873135 RepID=UPI00090326AC|nr:hypothetical protein [Shewanella sp. SACH]OUS52933.1 hypothetical protein BM607_003085 [Shewanella sp. SACH]
MNIDMEDFTLDMISAQAKAAQLKKETDAEKLPALFDTTLDALVSACEKLEAITAENDQLTNELEEVKALFVDAIGDGWYDGYMERIKDEKSDDCDNHSFTEEDVMHWSEGYESEHRYSKSIADIRAKAVSDFAKESAEGCSMPFIKVLAEEYITRQSAKGGAL